jgi:hypothetical protein
MSQNLEIFHPIHNSVRRARRRLHPTIQMLQLMCWTVLSRAGNILHFELHWICSARKTFAQRFQFSVEPMTIIEFVDLAY